MPLRRTRRCSCCISMIARFSTPRRCALLATPRTRQSRRRARSCATPHGNPTGLFVAKPNAAILYATLAKGPKLPFDYQLNSTRHFMRELNRLGVTGAIDAGGGFQNYPEDYAVIRKLAKPASSPFGSPIICSRRSPRARKQDFLNWTKTSKYKQGDDYFRHNGAGEMLVFSAADFEDFRQPRPDMPPEMEHELDDVVRILAQNRWPWRLHATYDETISRALDVFERVNQDIPLEGLNWFFDHAETISDRIDRAHRRARRRHRGATSHGLSGRVFRRALRAWRCGGDAADRANAQCRRQSLGRHRCHARRLLQSLGIARLACHRQDRCGLRIYPARNCLDRETALRMWTENVTWFSNEEGRKGRIQVGQLADLIVPDRDYFSCAEDEIADTTFGAHDRRRKGRLRRRRLCKSRRECAATRDAGLVTGAHLRRLCGLGRTGRRRAARASPQARNDL